MAKEFSFDIVSVLDMQEVDNAVQQAVKEIQTRFDFRGSKSQISLDKDKKTITLVSDNEGKMKSVKDVLQNKFVKREISLKSMVYDKVEAALSGTVRQVVTLQQGLSQDKAKVITKLLRDSGLKVRAQIQGDTIRVVGKSKDDLQVVMNTVREKDIDVPLQFINYR